MKKNPYILWAVSDVLFMLISNYGHSYGRIGYLLGLLVSLSIPSLLISGIVCLLFKNIRNMRSFWFGAAMINVLLIVISLATKLYMNNTL